MTSDKEFTIQESADAKVIPKRIAFIKGRTAARVKVSEEEMVMTFPNLVIKEIIAFEVLVIVLTLISLFVDAPLEWIANPEHTPNPAKAPWYFLGLQELLHYFPPVVGGVILPGLAVIALVVIPYFRVNISAEGLWKHRRRQTFVILCLVTAALSITLLLVRGYAILAPTLAINGCMLALYFSKETKGWLGWLGSRPLSWWIMTWFITIAVILTIIGTLFRGPEWQWTWPWQGIY